MAKCEKREIPQPKPQPPVEYVLTLSEFEAGHIEFVCTRFGSGAAISIARAITKARDEVMR